MSNIYLICIDDQPEVLNALEQNLAPFEEHIMLEVCDSGQEAIDLIDEIDAAGNHLAIVISDHVMPGMTGVDVLKTIQHDERFSRTKKILLTGLATHQDTIDAINTGGLNYYIQKPWNKHHLIDTLKKALTTFVMETGLDYKPLMEVLDQQTLYASLRGKT